MVTAFVLITSAVGKERDVVRDLLKLEHVKEAQTVYGDYDIIAKLEAETVDLLNTILLKQLRIVPQIVATTTLIEM